MFIKPFLKLLLAYHPVCFKKMILRKIFNLTAEIFACERRLSPSYPLPKINDLSYEEILKEFACFTRDQVQERLENKRPYALHASIQAALFKKAKVMGQDLRKNLRLRSVEDVMLVSRIIYQALQIDFSGNAKGEVRINDCYFKTFYSPEICRVISALDAGLASGLSGGGKLRFSARITEGKPTCCARLI